MDREPSLHEDGEALDEASALIDAHGARLSEELLARMSEGGAASVRRAYADAGADIADFFRDVYSSDVLDDSEAELMLETGEDGIPHVGEVPSEEEIARACGDALAEFEGPRP